MYSYLFSSSHTKEQREQFNGGNMASGSCVIFAFFREILYTQQKKLRKLCLRATTKDLKHIKTFKFPNSIM